ncbi:MAG TPA: shikimate dehydrogenase [Bryobacteraceae bacterium]|nr:shikimate dehydrogenase [Bryobacteraceae bacterium]
MALRTPLPKICIALGFPETAKLLDHARHEVEAGERFLEFRLDYLSRPEDGLQAIRQFVSEHPEVTLLATCRRHQNRGRFNGSVEEQIRLLESAVDAGARAVDVEVESAEAVGVKLEALRGRTCFILSYHNYESTPALEPVFRRMTKVPADAYKIVTTARKPSDMAKIQALAKAHPKSHFILLAMGEIGFPTRVLSPSWGGTYTYAAPNAAEGTAAGQMCARLLRTLYRIDKFTKAGKVYGVIADPVRHSISPAVHNRAFQSKRLDAIYLPFLVHPPHLKDFFTMAEALGVQGASVTIPHKQKVIRYLDMVDPLARRIGAVNTIWRKAGRWRGTNTDVEGITGPLGRRIRLSKSSILVVGNGGAARGATFALTDAGAKVALVGRNPDRVRALSKVSGAEPLLKEQLALRRFDAVVHATPLGMYPYVNECFFEGDIPSDLVFDMVYNPLETALLKRAREQGADVINGLEMFLVQAAHQFTIWTGENAPQPAMEKAALEALGHY